MGIYGEKTAASPEAFAAEKAAEAAGVSSVYGPLVTGQPAGEAAAPLEETPIGKDYTLNELIAAIDSDPKLAGELLMAELKRPQGSRKGALQFFAKLPLDADKKKLVDDALEVWTPPEE